MAQLVRHFIEAPRPCAYLREEQASLEYRLMVNVTAEELEALLLRGWRRFGPAYFRPACTACQECVSLRVRVDAFVPSPSQKKAMRRARRFRIEVGRPRVDGARLSLHAAWHATREEARGWEPTGLSHEEYATQFAFPSATGREAAWYDGERLLALGLYDETPGGVSAAYFFYHPDIAGLSPGVANVLWCVEQAKGLGLPYVYLGYRVEACESLKYKARFQPHQLLKGRPTMQETPLWVEGPSLSR